MKKNEVKVEQEKSFSDIWIAAKDGENQLESSKWKGIVEALLFASGDVGFSISQMASVLDITELQVTDIMESLKEDYATDTRGIHIVEMAGVFQLATKKEHSDYLKKLIESTNKHGLSQAALETLAIIAYKQPITRVEIEEIRGVKTERPLHTLVSKVLIKEVGRAEGQEELIYMVRRRNSWITLVLNL